MLSLLAALAAFLGRGTNEEAFGELSLNGREHLYETWGREIDPFWPKVRRRVREDLKV